MRFQVLFHSPPGVLFTFPSRYWFAIGHRVVFSLSGWSPMIPAGFHVPRRTQVPPRSMSSLRIRVSHPLRIPFPWDSPDSSCHLSRRSYNPGLCPVWAPPLSLAATYGIDFSFSSCRYLDVSVPCVLPRHDGRHAVSASKAEGFPPFGYRRVIACLPLAAAFRCSLRPSSPLCAQAFSVRPFFLDLVIGSL